VFENLSLYSKQLELG